jgi:hypothetical protein
MKLSKPVILFSIFLLIVFILTCCTREDPDKIRKEEDILELVNEINADSLENDVVWFQNMGTRFCFSNNKRVIAEKIKKRFISMGYDNTIIDSFQVSVTFRSVYYLQYCYNVIATLEGTEYPDSLCIVGGHYDDVLTQGGGDIFSVVPGANDNASGVAGVFETARVIKEKNFSPSGTIKFIAFGAEELGLLGSWDFSFDLNGFPGHIRFMLNFDMIAYETSPDPVNWKVNIMDYDNSHFLREEAEEMITKYTMLQYFNDNTFHNYSDSYPFSTSRNKAIFFFSGDSDPNYHTLSDIPANCNFEYCREIVEASCALLADKNWVPGN